MGLISRVSSRTYSKTGELGEEHLVCNSQSAKARKHITSFSKSPTSPSCYHFQKSQKSYHSSTNSPVRYKNQSLRKHHSLSKIKLSYEKPEERRRNSIESQQQRKTSSSQNFTKFPCQIFHKLL